MGIKCMRCLKGSVDSDCREEMSILRYCRRLGANICPLA